MTTNQLLLRLIDARVRMIHRGGGVLAAKGPSGPPSPALMDAIRHHKPELLRRMAMIERFNPGEAGSLGALIDRDYLQALADRFSERAAMIEIEGGLSREEAERLAHNEVLADALDERGGAMTPTSRTLDRLRRDGWTVAVVESWIPRLNIRRDLFGVADVLACKPGEPVLLIQATSTPNVAARVNKAKAEPRLRTWLACGQRFEVWGWDRRNGHWERRVVPLVLDDVAGILPVVPMRRKAIRNPPGLFDLAPKLNANALPGIRSIQNPLKASKCIGATLERRETA